MFRMPQSRFSHYVLLLTVTAALFLPGLGAPSLWDIDEGNNAEAAREMLELDNWIVPKFNFQLRVDKPALLYWLQIYCFQVFGVGEFAARLPSALAAMLTVLLVYELARRQFDAATGLLAGLVLASSLLFCGSAHFANPDALLNASTVASLFCFWLAFARSGAWLALTGLTAGLGFLAKGPIAVVLPWGVVLLFAFWSRRWRWLLRPGWLGLACLVFTLVAIPWFALVGAETRGQFLQGFFLTHNLGRFQAPMEGHGGPIYYHAVSLLLGFLPWSVFLLPALMVAFREARQKTELALDGSPLTTHDAPHHTRFLLCWIAVYFLFFSVSGTKLPNYILPLYPPTAILVAVFLERWRRGDLGQPAWVPWCLSGWALAGIGLALGLLAAGGVFDLAWLRGRSLPGLKPLAALGLVLVVGAAAGWLCQRRHAMGGTLAALAGSAALFTGGLAFWGGPALDGHKAPRALVEAAAAEQHERDVRVGCYQWYQPSLVFYCRREVRRLENEDQAIEFLQSALPVYLFLPAPVWQELQARAPQPHRLLARHWDFYRNCEVVVVVNE